MSDHVPSNPDPSTEFDVVPTNLDLSIDFDVVIPYLLPSHGKAGFCYSPEWKGERNRCVRAKNP
jgi:hypothetical protein